MPRFQLPSNYIELVAPALTAKRPARHSRWFGWALLWLLGISLPVFAVLYFLKGGS